MDNGKGEWRRRRGGVGGVEGEKEGGVVLDLHVFVIPCPLSLCVCICPLLLFGMVTLSLRLSQFLLNANSKANSASPHRAVQGASWHFFVYLFVSLAP